MKLTLASLRIIFVLITVVWAVAFKPEMVRAEEKAKKIYTFTFATMSANVAGALEYNPPHFRYAKMVEEETNGRIKIETKVDIIPDYEVPFAVESGRFDMGRFWTSWSSGTFPLWDYSLPFLFDHIYDYERTANDPRIIKKMEESYEKSGLVLLADFSVSGSSVIYSKKPIKTLNDLKGLKIRSTSLLLTLALKEMGAAPVDINYTEIIDSMNRGTVDAIISDYIWPWIIGIGDVAKYVNIWPITPSFGGSVVINKKKWDALPADLQQALKKVSRQMGRESTFASVATQYQSEVMMPLAGVEVIRPEKLEIEKARKLCQEKVNKKWLEIVGPEGQEILDIASE